MIVINLLIYQTIWLLCVLLGNSGALWSVLPLALHLLVSRDRRRELRMMLLLLMIGLTVDGALVATGVLRFASGGWPIPLWLATIWLGLAVLPHNSLRWLMSRPLLSALFGGLGGPLAYWAGIRLGAGEFPLPLHFSLLLLAVIWAALWPLVMHLAAIDGGSPAQSGLIKARLGRDGRRKLDR